MSIAKARQAADSVLRGNLELLRTDSLPLLRQFLAKSHAMEIYHHFEMGGLADMRHPYRPTNETDSAAARPLLHLGRLSLSDVIKVLVEESASKPLAYDTLGELLMRMEHSRIPTLAELRVFASECVNGMHTRPKKKGRHSETIMRDVVIARAVKAAKEAAPELHYRSSYGGKVCACSIVAECLVEMGLCSADADGYSLVERAWKRCAKHREAR